MEVICDYCFRPATLVNGEDLYPHRPDLAHKCFYQCKPCDAYVGCHPGTVRPLGRLANRELRRAKQRAHAAFDPVWKTGPMRRSDAYTWLANELGMDKADCHIGRFDVLTCQRVEEICRRHRIAEEAADNRRGDRALEAGGQPTTGHS